MTETLKVGDLAIYSLTGPRREARGKVVRIKIAAGGGFGYTTLDGKISGGTFSSDFKPVTKASEVYKIGDRVRLVKTGKFEDIRYEKIVTGTVKQLGLRVDRQDLALITWDQPVDYGTEWWISFKDIEPASEAPKGPVLPALPEEYILILFKDGKYLPSTEPKVYKSEAQAKRVARDMTERHGGEFRVMKLVGVSKAKPITTYEADLMWG